MPPTHPPAKGMELEYKTQRQAIEQLFLNPIHLLCRDNAVRSGAPRNAQALDKTASAVNIYVLSPPANLTASYLM